MVSGQELGGQMVTVPVRSLDTSSQIIDTASGLHYLMTGTEVEFTEFSTLVGYLLRGMVSRFESAVSSPYHNAGRVSLVRDMWWLIAKNLDHASRCALRMTNTWFRGCIPVFIDRDEYTVVIDGLTTGHILHSPIPISSLHTLITPTDAVSILDTIIAGEFPAPPQFFALVMLRSGRCRPDALGAVPARYLQSVDFARMFVRYCIASGWGRPASVLCGVLRAISLTGHLWAWAKILVDHPYWDWYSSSYRRLLTGILTRDDPVETRLLVPPGLISRFGEFVDDVIRCRSYRTAEVVIESDRFTEYYSVDPLATFNMLKKVTVWLCRRWRMTNHTLDRLFTVWDPVLTAVDKKRLYQALRDVLMTRPGCVQNLSQYQ